VPLKSGGGVENQCIRGRSDTGLTSMGKVAPTLYAGHYFAALVARITKVDVSTFSEVASLDVGEGPPGTLCLVNSDAFLYVGDDSNVPNRNIIKVDKSAFSVTDYLTPHPVGENSPYRLAISGGYLYAGFYTMPGKVAKVDLSTFTQVSTLTLAPGENNILSLIISGGYLYVGCRTFPGKIVKIDLSTFKKVSTLTLIENAVWDLVISGNYLYAGLEEGIDGKIAKIDLPTFTEVATLTLAAGEVFAMQLAVKGNYLYAGCTTAPSKVVKIDLSTFKEVSSLDLAVDEDLFYPTFVISGNNLFAGCFNGGKIVKIDLPTFTKVASLALTTVQIRSLVLG